MAMDQEVDVQLFITCRLCLDEPGSYQIVPCIKGQITDCFGIDIDPFDGLPQLICKKCKGILTDYYAIKKLFLEKQRQLHNKLHKESNNAQTSVKSSTAADVALAPNGNTEKFAVAADVTTHGHTEKLASATDVTPNCSSVNLPGKNKHKPEKRPSWKKAFNKYFLCTICNKSFLTEKSVKRHVPMHKKIISRHEKLFKNYLTVRLNKINEEENCTGSLQNVVYDKNKIICQRRHSKYNSFYLKKGYKSEIDENKNVAVKRPMVLADSSDDEILKGKKRKSVRFLSTSSKHTVVLEENKEPNDFANTDHQSNANGTVIIDNKYINLDDTSSDCPKNNTALEKKRILPKCQQVKAEVADYKAIQNIATMCRNNYIKKVQADTDAITKSTFSESSLKHKVLSLGRKVISKQGFSCTGLLRYMEHKDLDITWTPTSIEMQKKGSNFVRIMTKLKSREDSENDDACWKNLHDISFCRDSGIEAMVATISETSTSEEPELPVAPCDDPAFAGAPCESNDLNHKNKLLNKTPVANPKQLPKKSLTEIKPVIVTGNDAVLVLPKLEDADVGDSNMCMPIITSTMSLSVPVSEKENQEVPVSEKPAPRIKVKPVSELMSARALNSQETPEDVWSGRNFNRMQDHVSSLLYLSNTAVTVEDLVNDSHSFVSQPSATFGLVACQNDTQSQVGESNGKPAPNRNHEIIILDSPQFPNTKTRTPFQYFRKILLMFGLKLLDLNEDLPQHFNCLIKFKLMLSQGTKRPIGVLLSLFCSEDTFCFTFKDTDSKMFDPNQLNAYWQWELLKIYKGNVIDKIQQNAMKIGKEVHEYTTLFLCILKSINLITEA